MAREGFGHGAGEGWLGGESSGREGLGSTPFRVAEEGLSLVPRVSLSQLLCGGREGTPHFPGAHGGVHMLAVGLSASLIYNYCIGVIGP